MEIRPLQSADLDLISEIDGTIESGEYIHVERTGHGWEGGWKLQERPLRERLIKSFPIDDDLRFTLKQVAGGIDEGIGLVVEHDGQAVAMLLATPDFLTRTLRIRDLRVDYDHRRQGLATALLYQAIAAAREQTMRAVMAEITTENLPAARLLAKCGFELTGLDLQRLSNHDLVKEAVTLFWYASLE